MPDPEHTAYLQGKADGYDEGYRTAQMDYSRGMEAGRRGVHGTIQYFVIFWAIFSFGSFILQVYATCEILKELRHG